MSRSARGLRWRIRGWVAWFVVLNVLWLVLISAWVVAEEVLGLVAAAIGATAAEAVREQGLSGFRFRPRWVLRVRALPWQAVRETGWVLRALVGQASGRAPVRGRFRVVAVSLSEDRDEQAAQRALLTAGASFGPNSYVLAIDNRSGLMLTHELISEERA